MGNYATFAPTTTTKRSYDLIVINRWIDQGRLPNRDDHGNFDRAWQAIEDQDGSIYLLPEQTCEPPFAIVPEEDEFVVLVCDADDADELGPFPTLTDALGGIRAWLRLPQAPI